MNTPDFKTEICVVGAGLAGMAAALMVAKMGLQVLLLDEKKSNKNNYLDENSWDARTLALTPSTVNWLAEIGVWAEVNAARTNPITQMRLWQNGQENSLDFSAQDAHLNALGVVIEHAHLQCAMAEALAKTDVTIWSEVRAEALNLHENSADLTILKDQKSQKIQAELILAADGGNSWVRQAAHISHTNKPFNQMAMVAILQAEKPHRNQAYQWFLPHNTMAFLPLPQQQISLVWSLSTAQAQTRLNISAREFAQQVAQASGHMLGELDCVTQVQAIDLIEKTAETMVKDRVILLGDAAHTLHPLAGQGVNLGFRDVMALQHTWAQKHAMQTVADSQLLYQFARARKADALAMRSLTSGLNRWFAFENKTQKKLSDWGFKQLNGFKMAKKLLIQHAVK